MEKIYFRDPYRAMAVILDIEQRINGIKGQVDIISIQINGNCTPWYRGNTGEPAVNTVVRDLCKPGDTVFDVGGHIGSMTVAMSRSVGPRGQVFTFEASPRNIPQLQRNIVANSCFNSHLIHCAVYSNSEDIIQIRYSNASAADGIYLSSYSESIDVSTLSLDDFVDDTGQTPSFVKMDIEGAEYEALLGFKKTIERAHPSIVLEQFPSQIRCLTFMNEFGYRAVDVDTLEEITEEIFNSEKRTRNILYVHRESPPTPYHYEFFFHKYFEGSINIDPASSEILYHSEQIKICDGRHRIYMNYPFSWISSNDTVKIGVQAYGKDFTFYHGPKSALYQNHRYLIVNLPKAADLVIWIECLAKAVDTETVGITIDHVVSEIPFRNRRSIGDGLLPI
ncbi:FkbM family methyltransferase (plasmid) [Azospirillum sp. A26]|uniref:FkbM family methyltransferase n=1 Tax=Azospirillum sp. A26 TaxID=3160607 RepID=UPI003670A127